MDYFKIAKKVEKIFKTAYKKHMSKGVKSYSHIFTNDLITNNDLKMDTYISKKLKKHFPTFNLLTEELSQHTKLKDYTFVVDPIDGTCNFAAGLNLSGVQMALFKEETCVMSFIYLPYSNDIYYSVLNQGAYRNNKRIYIDNKIINARGILQISDFYQVNKINIDKQFQLVKSLQLNFLKTRLFGAACIDFTNLVSNKTQAYICYYHHLWDIAPGLLLIKEAGG